MICDQGQPALRKVEAYARIRIRLHKTISKAIGFDCLTSRSYS